MASEVCNGVEGFSADLADSIALVARLEVEAELPPRVELLRTNLASELASDFVEEGCPALFVLLEFLSFGERFGVAVTAARF